MRNKHARVKTFIFHSQYNHAISSAILRQLSLVLVCHFISLTGFGQQDLKTNFTPLKSKGELPAVFTQDIRKVIKQDLTELKNKKESDRGLKSTFLTASNYQIEHIIRSGSTLINDEITAYLNKVTDVVLKDNMNLRKQLNVFTLKSSVVNAYSFDKGYVFIDIGLIAQAETEAQLAYIICHEITHYTRQHHINSYVKNAEIDQRLYDGRSKEELFIEKCQYSKESESEADLEGFKLFERTAYNLKQAEKSFDMLQYAHLPFELVEFKKSYFESPNYVLPSAYFLKEVSPIKDNSNEDDIKQTHPNTKKRKLAIEEIVRNRDNSNRVNAIVGEEKFEYVRDLARMELCRLYLRDRDYPNALYAAYILSLKYPSNEFIAEVISKCMYAITLYDKGEISYGNESDLENGFPSYTDIESYPQQLYHLIAKMPENEWTILSLNYIYRAHKKYPANKSIMALSDSMFSLMKHTRWGISNFSRALQKIKDSSAVVKDTNAVQTGSKTDLIASLQKERSTRTDDTVYYKNIFVDLFMTDRAFAEKFPSSDLSDSESGSNFNSYGSYSWRKNKKRTLPVHKVLLLEPIFMQRDETQREKIQYAISDEKQENYSATINDCAKKLGLEVITLDPDQLKANEVDKMNDYSVLSDWFNEKWDSDKEEFKILNTDDIDDLIKKYGTQLVLRTVIVTEANTGGRKRTYVSSALFDINRNETVYAREDRFRTRDRRDLVNAKTYQMLFELKHPTKRD